MPGTDREVLDALYSGQGTLPTAPQYAAISFGLPASTATAFVTITGKIRVFELFGIVTTVIQTQTNNAKLTFNPTGTGTSTDLCAALNITAKAVGTILTISGNPADTLAAQSNPYIGLGMERPLILADGSIDLDCSATSTGAIAWYIGYQPMSSDAVLAYLTQA